MPLLRASLVVVSLCIAAWATPSAAITWVEIAEDEITCLGAATSAERASLQAPLLPRPLDAAGQNAYFGQAARNESHERLRYLTALSALAYSADRTNDQALRSQLLTTIAVFAQRYADAGQGAIFGQISRCARAAIVSAAIERDEPELPRHGAADL